MFHRFTHIHRFLYGKSSRESIDNFKIGRLMAKLPPEERNIFRKKVVSLATGVHHDNNASLLKFTAVLCFLGQSQFQSQKSQKNNSLFVCLCSVDVIERGIELCQYQITCYKFIKILIFWFAMEVSTGKP